MTTALALVTLVVALVVVLRVGTAADEWWAKRRMRRKNARILTDWRQR